MSGEKIYNIPLRVTFYCRVSTDSDIQLNSLENQLDYYDNYIKSKPKWKYVPGYVEEGVTGTRADKRQEFMKMIRDAKTNKFDLIVTKDVSRFARDLEDSIHYIRELKDAGVGVFFENQALNTFDFNSELTLNILFNIAQEESKKISTSVKFGYRKAIEKGHVLGSSNITGYRKDNCKLIVVPEEAQMIKKLFELYATGEYGLSKLARQLGEEGYLNKKGKLYDKNSLKRMIENPKYKGFYRARTYEVLDYRTKKRKKNSVEEQIIYKNEDGRVPAIVSEELWLKANEILKKRSLSYKNNNCCVGGVKYALSSKIYCKDDNTIFQRTYNSRNKKRAVWCCGLYLQHSLALCSSPIIAEVDLYNIFLNIMRKTITNKELINNDLCKIYADVDKTKQYDIELQTVEEQLKNIESKKNMLLDLVFSGEIKREQLKGQFIKYEKEIKELEKKKRKILTEINIKDTFNLEKIKYEINNQLTNDLLEDFIRNFVSKIIISKINNNRHYLNLDIYMKLINSDDIYNNNYSSIEKLRKDRQTNKFTYNVFFTEKGNNV